MDSYTFDPGPLADVSTERSGERWTLVFVRDFPHPPEKVWAALTEPGQLAQWAPFVADRDLGAPGSATLTMVDGEQPTALPPAQVSQADAPTLLEYTWGSDLLRWELVGIEEGTRLTLRHTVADQEFVRKVAAGWHLCLMVAEHMLDGDPITPIRGEAALDYGFSDLQAEYGRKLQVPDEPSAND